MQKSLKNPYNWFIGVMGLICGLPFVAPLLLKLGEYHHIFLAPARLLYLVYSFTCHQFASRSIHLFGYQLAWCARDTGIWTAMFAGAVLVKVLKLKGIKWYWVIPFVIPIALDGGIQTVATALNISPVGVAGDALYISSNVMRFMTGSLFGLGVSLWLSPLLADSFDEKYHQLMQQPGKLLDGWKQLRVIMVTMVAFFCLYVGLVAIWNATSKTNKPSDWLDAAVKTPATDFYTRRGDGVCPTTATDLFNFNCLIGQT